MNADHGFGCDEENGLKSYPPFEGVDESLDFEIPFLNQRQAPIQNWHLILHFLLKNSQTRCLQRAESLSNFRPSTNDRNSNWTPASSFESIEFHVFLSARISFGWHPVVFPSPNSNADDSI
jgi:hypothetical protein